jgi:hypothetical protein
LLKVNCVYSLTVELFQLLCGVWKVSILFYHGQGKDHQNHYESCCEEEATAPT